MKGKIAWLVRGVYRESLKDEDDWEIIFEEPYVHTYKEVQKVVLFEIE